MKTRKFLKFHPFCAFCGGGTAATTQEHCPPRGMFRNRGWPEGYSFPACADCNGGTQNDDLLISFVALATHAEPLAEDAKRFRGIIDRAFAAHPGMREYMLPGACEARKFNRRYGIRPTQRQTHQEAAGIIVPRELTEAFAVFVLKLTKACFYNGTGRIFPASGCIFGAYTTNAALDEKGNFKLLNGLSQFAGEEMPLIRARTILNDQLSLKVNRHIDWECKPPLTLDTDS